jgi:hypothetical protein
VPRRDFISNAEPPISLLATGGRIPVSVIDGTGP